MRAYFDIETGGRDPRKAKVWVMSYIGDGDSKPSTHSLYKTQDEGRLIKDIGEVLSDYSEIVSWNGWRFDVPFINFRAARTGAPRFQHDMHTDLGIVAKNRYGLRYWNMDAVAKAFGVEDSKTPFDEGIWLSAANGNELAWDYIMDHCERDVKVLRGLYGSIMLEDYVEVLPDAIGPAA